MMRLREVENRTNGNGERVEKTFKLQVFDFVSHDFEVNVKHLSLNFLLDLMCTQLLNFRLELSHAASSLV